MSYGWLSESTLAPKKAKSLQVPKGSISVLNKLIYKHVSGTSSIRSAQSSNRLKDPFEAKNPGVELRNRVDRLSKSSQSRRIRDRLEEKAKLYDSIVEGHVSDLPEGVDVLVDFESKRELDSAACTVQDDNTTILLPRNPDPVEFAQTEAVVNNQSLEDISALSDKE